MLYIVLFSLLKFGLNFNCLFLFSLILLKFLENQSKDEKFDSQ